MATIRLGQGMVARERVSSVGGVSDTSTATSRETRALDEAEILAAAVRDPRAFAPLYEAYVPLIHAYCLRRLRDPEAAADATSQVFINVIQSLPRFRPHPDRAGSSFRSWLFSIAHNVVIDAVRRSSPDRMRLRSLDQPDAYTDGGASDLHDRLADARADADPTPEEWVLAAESRAELADLLETLPERQRAIVEFRLAGLSNAEIAEALGMSYPAVRSAQYRAFLELRRLLDPSRHAFTPAERQR